MASIIWPPTEAAKRKWIRDVNKFLETVLYMFFMLLFFFGSYVVYDTVYLYSRANNTSVRMYKPMFMNDQESDNTITLADLSDDAMAWLVLDDTSIDYPVMYTNNNSFYLNHDPFGEFSLSGSIFVDCQCDGDFTDQYTLVHGHHMEGGAMFGALEQYLNEEFYKSHRTGQIMTRDGRLLNLQIFAVSEVSAYNTKVFDPTKNQVRIWDTIPNTAIYYEEPDIADQVIALATCKAPQSIERIVIFATVTETTQIDQNNQ